VVFIDWRMPGMDGIQTARSIRQLELAHPPLLVMVTAYGREEVLRDAEEAGIRDVLIKPVSASLLFDTLMQLLGGERLDIKPEAGVSRKMYPAAGLSALHGSRILVVEDNEMNQEVARDLLVDVGATVDIANQGQEGVEKVMTHTYDAVLMDMQMPVMDGIAATKAIRRDSRHQSLPIIAMTANAMQKDQERCLAAGMNDYVTKPVDPDHLFKVLLKWIAPEHGRAEPLSAMPAPRDDGLVLDLPVINGLDVEMGLRRVLGKRPLYHKLLHTFIQAQGTIVAEIESALRTGNRATAERLAHTAKGVSGNIGATVIEGLAAELERVIRENAPPAEISQHLDAFAQAQSDLLSALRQALSEPSATRQDPAGPDAGALPAILALLRDFLADDDAQAHECFESHQQALRSGFGEAAYLALERAIGQYDYPHALETLLAEAARLGVALS